MSYSTSTKDSLFFAVSDADAVLDLLEVNSTFKDVKTKFFADKWFEEIVEMAKQWAQAVFKEW